LIHVSQECNFVSHIATTWRVDKSLFSDAEWEKYQEGLQKLENYRNMKEFMENMNDFYWELKSLYMEVSKEIATPNAWSRREVSNLFNDYLRFNVVYYSHFRNGCSRCFH